MKNWKKFLRWLNSLNWFDIFVQSFEINYLQVFKPTVGYSSNEVMLLGTINHALFDAAIRTQQFDPIFLRKKLKSILEQDDIIDSLSCMDSKKDEMLKKLLPSVELISLWGKKFCQEKGGVISYGQKGDELTKIVKVCFLKVTWTMYLDSRV